MKLNEILNEDDIQPTITVRKVDEYTNEGDPENLRDDVTYEVYQVYYGDRKIGELAWDDYFDNIAGTIGKRHIKFEKGNRSVEDAVSHYFTTPTGQKFLEVLNRQTSVTRGKKYDEDDIYSVRKWHNRVRRAYPGVKIWKDERHHRFIASMPDERDPKLNGEIVGVYDYESGSARIGSARIGSARSYHK